MSAAEKLENLKTFVSGYSDEVLTKYLDMAKQCIRAWKYNGNVPATVTDVPYEDEMTQVMACVAGINERGAEGQSAHSENGVSMTFRYADMNAYVKANVIPYAVVK